MTALVIVAIVVAVVVVVALVATNPMMRRREDEAIAAVKGQLGACELIEPRATAMGTEPEEAGGVRGMACLGLSDAELMAVTWAGQATWRIPRASVVGIDTSADDPAATPKATITLAYARPEGGEATAMFRLRDAADWLGAFGYDDESGTASGGDGDGDGDPGVALGKESGPDEPGGSRPADGA